ncbi:MULTISPECIES: hypothetical protein [Gammaproteobacteria]|uniref:hypothetical protein n=1 Tax=Gammaproteobacteria TaxID=1236 RepID=UPI000DD04194|nr:MULTISPECIES: hypothetical protein [Gammaproteobacteria]RTE86630.1 hypothetical protein DQX04_08740 [Aliidiomarina sp. B3213]TCZ90815.1 hypothetical protein EYQ95_08305 [Lysobacter sp. N42]
MTKQRAVVICPGRGTYNRKELGYLARYHADKKNLLDEFDALRQQQGKATLASLDSANVFKSKEHLQAQNAAPLIMSCAYADFLSIDRDKYDIVAVTGNSMGWYIALTCAQAVEAQQGFDLVSTMSDFTQGADLGGQLIYPLVNEQWELDDTRVQDVKNIIAASQSSSENQLYMSIEFGGYAVLAGSHAAIREAKQKLPVIDDQFPMELPGHSAFHTPLMQRASEKAFDYFGDDFFASPHVPLVDGDGRVWQPQLTQPSALREYTLNNQVTQTYGFSKAVSVALREFAPDTVILTGPGSTMGGAVAQVMINEKWQNLANKDDFIARQDKSPILLAMGLEEQRKLVVS